MFLLDTNAISALRRTNHANSNVLAWAARINLADFFLSTITVFEIERGILLLDRLNHSQAAILRAWMDDHVMADFADRILPVDNPVARRCAVLHVPDPRPERDAMIAATALVHGLTVVTRNTADFLSAGVPLLNPWEDPA